MRYPHRIGILVLALSSFGGTSPVQASVKARTAAVRAAAAEVTAAEYAEYKKEREVIQSSSKQKTLEPAQIKKISDFNRKWVPRAKALTKYESSVAPASDGTPSSATGAARTSQASAAETTRVPPRTAHGPASHSRHSVHRSVTAPARVSHGPASMTAATSASVKQHCYYMGEDGSGRCCSNDEQPSQGVCADGSAENKGTRQIDCCPTAFTATGNFCNWKDPSGRSGSYKEYSCSDYKSFPDKSKYRKLDKSALFTIAPVAAVDPTSPPLADGAQPVGAVSGDTTAIPGASPSVSPSPTVSGSDVIPATAASPSVPPAAEPSVLPSPQPPVTPPASASTALDPRFSCDWATLGAESFEPGFDPRMQIQFVVPNPCPDCKTSDSREMKWLCFGRLKCKANEKIVVDPVKGPTLEKDTSFYQNGACAAVPVPGSSTDPARGPLYQCPDPTVCANQKDVVIKSQSDPSAEIPSAAGAAHSGVPSATEAH